MTKRKLHIVPCVFLAMLLLFGNAPKAFIHLFTAHKDTVHLQHKKGEVVIDNEHHHCSFLSDALPLFVGANAVSIPTVREASFFTANLPLPAALFAASIINATLRGPPENAC